DSALHALGLRSASHLAAEGPHDDDLLLRKLFRNKQPDFVAAAHSNQGEPDPRISGGGFDDSTTRLQFAFALGALNQSDRGAVFHAAPRVQVFEFGENVG